MNKWCKALNKKCCGGYYSEKPCKAKSCNPKHDYCKEHKKILKLKERA